MAVLSKETIQRLAVLRALTMWRRGAYGPLRVHKTLFFADKNTDDDRWRIFTFRRWYLGQYSDEISEALNALRNAGRIHTAFDGPSERIKAHLSGADGRRVDSFFSSYFPQWRNNLPNAHRKWAYLKNDDLVRKAHEDDSYTTSEHGEIIFSSFAPEFVECRELSDEWAEQLSDLVDDRLQRELAVRISRAAKRSRVNSDWRHEVFGDPPVTDKIAS